MRLSLCSHFQRQFFERTKSKQTLTSDLSQRAQHKHKPQRGGQHRLAACYPSPGPHHVTRHVLSRRRRRVEPTQPSSSCRSASPALDTNVGAMMMKPKEIIDRPSAASRTRPSSWARRLLACSGPSESPTYIRGNQRRRKAISWTR